MWVDVSDLKPCPTCGVHSRDVITEEVPQPLTPEQAAAEYERVTAVLLKVWNESEWERERKRRIERYERDLADFKRPWWKRWFL